MVKAVESDWATERATRVIRGYRVFAGRSRELRDEIAKALRKVNAEAREAERVAKEAEHRSEGFGISRLPAADCRIQEAQATA